MTWKDFKQSCYATGEHVCPMFNCRNGKCECPKYADCRAARCCYSGVLGYAPCEDCFGEGEIYELDDRGTWCDSWPCLACEGRGVVRV